MTRCGCAFKPCDPDSVKMRLPNGLVLGISRKGAQGYEYGSPFSPDDPGGHPPGFPSGSQSSGSHYSQDSGSNGVLVRDSTVEPVSSTGVAEARSSAQYTRAKSHDEEDSPNTEGRHHHSRGPSPTPRDENRSEWGLYVPPGNRSPPLPGDGNRKGFGDHLGKSSTGEGSSRQPVPEADSERYVDPTPPQPRQALRRNVHPIRKQREVEPKKPAQPSATPPHAPDPAPLLYQGLASVEVELKQPTTALANTPLPPPQCLHIEEIKQAQPATASLSAPAPSSRCPPPEETELGQPAVGPMNPSPQSSQSLHPRETEQDQRFMSPRKAPEPPTTRSPYVTIIQPEPLAPVQANTPATVPALRQTWKERLQSAGRWLRGLFDSHGHSDASHGPEDAFSFYREWVDNRDQRSRG